MTIFVFEYRIYMHFSFGQYTVCSGNMMRMSMRSMSMHFRACRVSYM